MAALTRESWQRVEELLHAALDLPADRRPDYLDRACGGDAELRDEVEGLIVYACTDPARFEKPVALRLAGGPRQPVTELAAGDRLGAWRIERLLGRGGMGEVYLAARADGQYQQQVAVKVMRREAVEHLDRFHAERRILAQLEHPGIARLLDSGVAPGERPYMLMEYVFGQPIGEYCATHQLPLRARIGLFLQVCEAVSYAHAHLIVHRDLKPGNILVSADGRVKLLDFGIAKVLNADWAAGDATVTHAAPMTPGHAAPEQLQGEPVSTATDVYALGIVLYGLLAGRGPWDLRQLPAALALHKLLHEDVPPASEVAAQDSAPPVEPRALRGDLDAILGKALRKAPAERYATANALREDLQRYLDGEPVRARPDSALYRARKFVRRHYVWVGVAAVMLVTVSLFVWRLAVERDRALDAVATAQAVSAFLSQDMFAQIGSDQRPLRDLTVKELLDGASAQVDKRFEGRPDTAIEVHLALGSTYVALDDAAASSRHLERSLELLAAQGKQDTEPALEATAQLIELREVMGQLAQHIDAYEALLAGGRLRLGAGNAHVLRLSQQVAWGRLELGDWVQARDELRRTLAAAGEGDVVFTANTERTLGRALILLGDYREAETVLESAIARLVPQVGEGHRRVAQSRTLLAEALIEQGRLPEAEKEIMAALAAADAWAPNQAIGYLLRAQITLGRLRAEQGRLDEAAKVLQNSLQRYLAQKMPLEKDQSALWRRPLADVLQRSGRPAAALEQFRLALAASLQSRGADHPETQEIRIGLASLLMESDVSGARSAIDAVNRARLDALPLQHPIRGELRRVDGLLAQQAGNTVAAREALQEALEISEFRFGPRHWRTQRVRNALARLARAGGNG